MSGKGDDGHQHDLHTDNAGNLNTLAYGAIANPEVSLGNTGIAVDPYGRLNVISTGILNDVIVGQRQNQIEVNFSQPSFDNGSVINSTANGGSAVQVNGEGSYSTGRIPLGRRPVSLPSRSSTAPAASASTNSQWAFTPGVAASYQRIGLFTNTGGSPPVLGNGFFLGYEGTTLNISHRLGGVDTHYPKSSWLDPLDGSAGSKFTRSGAPEAIDFTKLNLFRTRWSWFGSSPIQWEVMSPDGYWITWFRLAYPNSATVPSLTDSNLTMMVDVANTGNTSNLTVITPCWAAGNQRRSPNKRLHFRFHLGHARSVNHLGAEPERCLRECTIVVE